MTLIRAVVTDQVEPIYRPLPLVAVALFATNNFFAKAAFPGWWTGKLSDFLACFFLPLFVAALLQPLERFAKDKEKFGRSRDLFGVFATVLVFSLAKTSAFASQLLDALLAAPGAMLGLSLHPNTVDQSDLLALPLVGVGFVYARTTRRARTR